MKQNALVERFNHLFQRLSNTKLTNNVAQNGRMKALIWRQYNRLNQQTIDLCHEIEGLNMFWSGYVTIFYVVFVFFIAYSVYIIFIVPTALKQTSIFVVLLFYAVTSMFLMLKHCANIVGNNQIIDYQNRAFLIHFQQNKSFRVIDILKVFIINLFFKISK